MHWHLALLFFSTLFLGINTHFTTPEQVVDAQLEAYNNRDIEAFVDTYAEDIVVYEYGQPNPFIEGKQTLRVSYSAVFQTSPNLNAVSSNRIVQGNKVIDHEIANGINGGGPVQVVVIYEIENELIRKVTFIY